FQAEDGIRDRNVTGVQTCALPISELGEFVEGSVATIGITDHAQHALGDIVFVELPKLGAEAKFMKPVGVVESVKAASDVFSPLKIGRASCREREEVGGGAGWRMEK